ncbi:MAG: carboxypeptidase regulatory-like domain-containing protein [Acidobacteriota bacterium]|nr:carboxypeptidase regulatory-like domain-containing protein [Acidobacteriota bacterium]
MARRRIFLSAVLVLLPVAVIAQTVTGTIQGTVTERGGGGFLPGVTVTARNMDTGEERVAHTSESGLYVIAYVPIGKYRVMASLAGMGEQTKTGVDVGLNFTRTVNFSLAPQVSETVTVTADQPRINTVSGEIKKGLTAQEVIDKPIAPQQGPTAFLNLAETFGGFSQNPTSGQNNFTASSGSSINFGAGTRGATFQTDGINNDDSSENQHRQGVALSTIKEFQILTNNYSAEFGRGYGAVVLVQTKSGTNRLTGDIYGFYTKNKWDSVDYFAAPGAHLPPGTRGSAGATSGFPIMKDRLFAFVSGERNAPTGQLVSRRDIPLASDLASPRLTLNNDTPANRAFLDNILGRFPSGAPNRTDLGARVYETNINIIQPDKDATGRVDFEINPAHHLTSRYQYSAQVRTATDYIIGEQALQNHHQRNYGGTYTHVLGSNVVGEFRYGLGLRKTHVDILAGNDTPVVRYTNLSRTPIIGNAGNFPIHRDQRDNQFVYNLSGLFFTNHALKAGTDIRRQSLDDLADNFSRGFWTFRAASCGQTFANDYAAMLAGCVRNFQKGYGNFFLENRINEKNFYVQDDWHVFRNTTLNLGARYESVDAPKEIKNRVDYQFGRNSYVDPRLGFAQTVGLDNRFLNYLTGGPNQAVLRGGWGRFHGRVFQSIFSQGGANLRNNPPNGAFLNILDVTNLSDPTNGFVFVPGQPLTIRVGGLLFVDPKLKMPSTDQWNITFERTFILNSSIRLSYTSKISKDLLRYVPDNLPLDPRIVGPVTVVDHPFNAPAAGLPDLRGKQITKLNSDPCAGTGLPGVPTTTACPNAVPLAENEFSFRVPRYNERRPDPRYATNLRVVNDAESDYRSLEFEWAKHFSQNLHFQLNYTYSRYFDNNSEATFVGAGDSNGQGPNAKKYAWGHSRFDSPHRITLYGTYALPFFKDRKDILGLLLGGWRIAPVYKYSTGTPFTVTSNAVDLDLDSFSESRPVLVDPSVLGRKLDDPRTSQQKLPASAFRNAQFGDTIDMLVPRNAFRIGDTKQLDLGIYKSIPMPRGDSLVLRFEGYNVTNRSQFGFPASTSINSAAFATLTSQINTPRVLQVGVRYIY